MNNYTISEKTGEVLNTLHTAISSDEQIIKCRFGQLPEKLNDVQMKRMVSWITQDEKGYRYLLSNPHRDMSEKFGADLTLAE